MRAAIEALGDDFDELIALLGSWGAKVVESGGYIGGPVDFWPVRDS